MKSGWWGLWGGEIMFGGHVSSVDLVIHPVEISSEFSKHKWRRENHAIGSNLRGTIKEARRGGRDGRARAYHLAASDEKAHSTHSLGRAGLAVPPRLTALDLWPLSTAGVKFQAMRQTASAN